MFSAPAAYWLNSSAGSMLILSQRFRGRRKMATKPPAIGAAQFKLLEKLCNAVSVSGEENEVRKIVLEEIGPYADDVKVDALGNLLATKKGHSAKRLRVMLDAHMDEVGFMLVAEEGDGIYEFKTI